MGAGWKVPRQTGCNSGMIKHCRCSGARPAILQVLMRDLGATQAAESHAHKTCSSGSAGQPSGVRHLVPWRMQAVQPMSVLCCPHDYDDGMLNMSAQHRMSET